MTDPTDPTGTALRTPTSGELLDASATPLVVIDRDYVVVRVNAAYCARYGTSPEAVIGRRCHEVSHQSAVPCSRRGEHCPLETALETGGVTQAVHVHRAAAGAEERVRLEARPVRDRDGIVRWVVESVQSAPPPHDDGAILVGQSPPLRQLVDLLGKVAPTDVTVLLLGESGTGKERAAEYLHVHSRRSAGPFVIFDCGGFSEALIESELFGYERGAFTGASARKLGLFEAAAGGTLFIDEIGDLPLAAQGRLLRVLETGTIRRVGGTGYVPVDVRVIAATNRDLDALVRDGRFRGDLYFRLSAFPVRVPPLRDRLSDVPALATQFLAAMRGGRRHLPLSDSVLARLAAHDYPGNVRELRNVIERAAILADRRRLRPEDILFDAPAPAAAQAAAAATGAAGRALIDRRRRPSDAAILEALTRAGGHRGRAAELLGINERTLYRYLTRLRLPSAGA